MTILSESFLALVGSHLVAFSFLSVGHIVIFLVDYIVVEKMILTSLLCFFNLVGK